MSEKFHILLRDERFETYRAGDTIFEEGQAGDRMYAVRSGTVEIVRGDQILERVETGEIFGEMALIEHGPRSALARAKTDCEVVPIDEKRFQFLVQQTPMFALRLMRVVVDRLRRTTERLGDPARRSAAGPRG
jgi:CRP-like cAMP-binding protein